MTMNLSLTSIVKSIKFSQSKTFSLSQKSETLLIINQSEQSNILKKVKSFLATYQWEKIKDSKKGLFHFETAKGLLSILLLPTESTDNISHEGLLDESNYSFCRDNVGEYIRTRNLSKKTNITISSFGIEYDEFIGSLLGVEMGFYHFHEKRVKPEITFSHTQSLTPKTLKEIKDSAVSIGQAVNISRHLVNTSPSHKRPLDYSQAVKSLFSKSKNSQVHIWDSKRLEKENMGLILAVGSASEQAPCMVHIKYRPKKMKDMSPVAFVGKGVTFDSGGLNIKPGGSMRFMKKDMGGSSTIVALAYWIDQMNLDIPCDFYIGLAENAISSKSFRPGDIVTAHNGMTVEIDNTDAEGRLVMADVMSVATSKTGKDKPEMIIDVATLTGAIKVGLGSDIGGLFTNDDDMAFILQSCAQLSGDYLWRMPLMNSQKAKLKSDFATMVNSAGGFGGAISAAMFLQEFTNNVPWAHLDVYHWIDAAQGPYAHSGGNGQAVQCLAQFLSQL